MATSIWEVATEGISSFDIVGGYMSDVELSYEDRAAIDVATESDTGFVDYINECQMALMDNTSKTFAQESVLAIQVAKGMDMYTAMEGLKNTIRNAWEAIKEFLQKVWETIKEYVKKAKDWLIRRASLGKAMLTKYSSVLRNKKVSDNLEFDWCDIKITELVKLRESTLNAAYICANAGDLKDLQETVEQHERALQDSKTQREILASLNRTMMKDKDGDARELAYDAIMQNAPQKLKDNIKRDTNFNGQHKYEGTVNGKYVMISAERVHQLYLDWCREERKAYKILLDELKPLKYAFSTQELTEMMNKAVYDDPKGPVHGKKKWSIIKSEVMNWADMDPSRYLTEALGVFEKDSNAMMKIIKQQQKDYEEAIDEDVKSGGLEKKAESMVRNKVRQIAAGGAKIHKMYITHLKEAISLMQTQAIAAARKAILDKSTTTNESYIFNGMDVIY